MKNNVIRSKYHQGTLKSRWKIQQCQGEQIHFGYKKDCSNCDGRHYCYSTRFYPCIIELTTKTIIFAETKEEAEDYVAKGYGWRTDWKCDGHIPIKIKNEGDKLSWEIDFDSPL